MSSNNKTIGLEGFDELEKGLIDLADLAGDKEAFAAMNFAIRKALKPVKERAEALVSYDDTNIGDDSVHLRNSIKIQVPKNAKKVSEKKGRAAFGLVSFTAKGNNVAKAIALEFGLSNKDYPPKPFLRPALYQRGGAALKILSVEMERAITRRAKKAIKARGGK